MKNLYVGNLDTTTTESQLKELFSSYGAVETVTIVMDRDTGTPRGFAFVEMTDDQEADAAIKGLQGTVLSDRPLSVSEARPKEEQNPAREPLVTRKHRQHRY